MCSVEKPPFQTLWHKSSQQEHELQSYNSLIFVLCHESTPVLLTTSTPAEGAPSLLHIIEHVSKQRQVPRNFLSQEHIYSPGWRVILLPVPLTHVLSKFTIRKVNCYNMRPNCLSMHILSDNRYPLSENWRVLDSNPCPGSWVDNAQSPFFVLFYIYILG